MAKRTRLSNGKTEEHKEKKGPKSRGMESRKIKSPLKHEALFRSKGKNKKDSEEEEEVELDRMNEASDSESEAAAANHKAALVRLKENDPEFYKYLEENDQELLNFSGSDSDDDENDDDSARAEKFHKIPEKLDVDSDDSEVSEAEIEKASESRSGQTTISPALVAKWKIQLEETPDGQIIRTVIAAFQAATRHAKDDSAPSSSKFIVEDSGVFNGVMRLCIADLMPAVHKFLKLPAPTTSKSECKPANISKNRNWARILPSMKIYLLDVIKILSSLTETDVLVLLLRHVLYLIPFYLHFAKHSRLLLKKMISFWCMGEESVRVLAFLCIMRTVRALPPDYLDYILKKMYLSYVSNAKFTSPSTWPLINFMKRSLVELYSLDTSVGYQHTFVYIKQLAIHLRNGIALKKKDAFQAVYNWQFVHCLLLWEHLLSTVYPSDVLKPLIYPLTQVMLGTARLIPTDKYCPLRFHLVRSLTQLSKNTNTFIPVLPLILETLRFVDSGKKHTALSMKPLDFSCALKLSKKELQENGFKNAVVDQIYEHTVEYLNGHGHTIGFPELVLPTVIQLKSFLKTCKVANHCRQVKQLLEKIEENSKFIAGRRKKVNFAISDFQAIAQWEALCQQEGTPLSKYYETWRKLKNREILLGMTQKEKNPSENLPTIKRQELQERKQKDRKEFTTLFESDSEEMDFNIDSSNEEMISSNDDQ